MSQPNFSSVCQQAYANPPSPDNTAQLANNLMQNLQGATKCDLNSFYAAIGAEASGPFGLGNAKISGQINDLNKAGCQTVSIIMGNYLNSVYQARCIIDQDEQSAVTEIDATNDINLIISGSNITLDGCPNGTNWTQSISGTVKSLNKVSAQSQSAISDVISAGLQTTANQLGDLHSGFQSTGSGAVYTTNMISKIQSASTLKNVRSNVASACTKIKFQNLKNYVITGTDITTLFPCFINQSSIMDAQVANIVASAYSADMMSAVSQFLQSDAATKISSFDAGAPDVVGNMFKDNWMIIVGAIAALIVGFIVIKMMKDKKLQSSLSSSLPKSLTSSLPTSLSSSLPTSLTKSFSFF